MPGVPGEEAVKKPKKKGTISAKEACESIAKLRRTARYVRMEGIFGEAWADAVDATVDECARMIRRSRRKP